MIGMMGTSGLPGGTGAVFAWTLIHSVWQAALVAAGLWLVLRLVPGSMPRVRTAAASGALALVLGLGFATWLAIDADWRQHDACWSSESHAMAHPASCASHGVPLPAEVLGIDVTAAETKVVLPWAWVSLSGLPFGDEVAPAALAATDWTSVVVMLWLAVALVAIVRLAGGLWLLRRVLRRSRPVGAPEPLDLLRRAARRAGVRRPVELRESAEISAPAVAGWRRPVVLLPEGMSETLEPAQLGCVLAHELVHVRRGHFLWNLGQRALDGLLMISPGALWISRRIREEREALCDHAAAGVPAGARRNYVETLLRLESLRAPTGPALIGLLGEGPLLRRVRRLVEGADGAGPRGPERVRRGLAAGLVVAAMLFAIGEVSVTAMAVSSWAVMEHDIHAREVPDYEISTTATRAAASETGSDGAKTRGSESPGP